MPPDSAAGLTTVLVFAALLTAHHLADHWIQTGHQAAHKGDHTRYGQWMCARHVSTYTLTATLFVLAVAHLPLGAHAGWQGIAAGQVFSAVTHYAIDRRWTLAVLARALGKHDLHRLGQPRLLQVRAIHVTTKATTGGGQRHHAEETVRVPLDNPVLGTGAYSLDQALHIAALFVSALLTALI
jgi:hypothetical protein